MSCLNSLKGMQSSFCDANLAGIQAIWLTDNLDNLTITADTVSSSNTFMEVTAISGATFYKYGIEQESGYLTSTAALTDNGRLRYYNNAIRVVFPKLNREHHLEFLALTHNPTKAIVLDNNGIYHFLGVDSNLVPNGEPSATTGQAYEDDNQYEVILQARSAYPSFIMSEQVAKTVISDPDVVAGA